MDQDAREAENTSNKIWKDDKLPSILLVPQLQQMASVKICLILWTKDTSIRQLAQSTLFDSRFRKRAFHYLFKKNLEAIDKLNLPEALKRKLFYINDGIGLDIELWYDENRWVSSDWYFEKFKRPDAMFEYLKKCFVWTNRGIIDRESTARNIILYSQHTPTNVKFSLACGYCLEDILRNQFINKLKTYTNLENTRDVNLVVYYWACRLIIGDIDIFYRSVRNIFGYYVSSLIRTDSAARLIFNGLTAQEKQELVLANFHWFGMETQMYLLSQVNIDLQKRMYVDVIPCRFDKIYERRQILWEDCLIFYIDTYSIHFSKFACKEMAEKLAATRISSIGFYCNVTFYLHVLWSSIAEESREYVLKNSTKLLSTELLETFLFYRWYNYIEKLMLYAAEKHVINTPHHFVDSNSRKKFKSIYHLCKNHESSLEYHSRTFNPRLAFLNDYLLRNNNCANALKCDMMQADIQDIFVEYCRCHKMEEIDKLLKSKFDSEEERGAYKATLLHPIFYKLLNIDVIENDYLEEMKMLCPIVDSFLKWYFNPKHPEKVRNFKSQILYDGNVTVIEYLIEQKSTKLKDLVHWFLSYDEAEIGEFKRTCKRSELIALI